VSTRTASVLTGRYTTVSTNVTGSVARPTSAAVGACAPSRACSAAKRAVARRKRSSSALQSARKPSRNASEDSRLDAQLSASMFGLCTRQQGARPARPHAHVHCAKDELLPLEREVGCLERNCAAASAGRAARTRGNQPSVRKMSAKTCTVLNTPWRL
jgi:hypothetical protein